MYKGKHFTLQEGYVSLANLIDKLAIGVLSLHQLRKRKLIKHEIQPCYNLK